jgi:DivIVA domain-containing protein
LQDVADCVFIVAGAMIGSRALPSLVRTRRSGSRPAAIPAGLWSDLLLGVCLLTDGVFNLCYPHGGWQHLIPGVAGSAVLTLVIAGWIVSRRRPRRLVLSSADPPDLISGDTYGPGPVSAPDARATGLIERINKVKFGTTRLAPGYDEEEVDVFLDKLVAALGRDGQLDRSELRDIQFSKTRLRPGYAMPDVDAFLAEVAQASW